MSQNHKYIWATNDPNEIKSLNIPHHCWTCKNSPSLILLESSKALFQKLVSYSLGWELTIDQFFETSVLRVKSKAVQNTVDHCPLTSSHLHIPQVTCQSVKVMKAINGYHLMKRNNTAPIKGNEAVICKAWVYALESARRTVPYSAVWLGGGAGGWRVTG